LSTLLTITPSVKSLRLIDLNATPMALRSTSPLATSDSYTGWASD
jgi:hypothetical protein